MLHIQNNVMVLAFCKSSLKIKCSIIHLVAPFESTPQFLEYITEVSRSKRFHDFN